VGVLPQRIPNQRNVLALSAQTATEVDLIREEIAERAHVPAS
jgi:hypothetical protein